MIRPASGPRGSSRHLTLVLFVTLLTSAGIASAATFGNDDVNLTWDTTLAFGASWRLDDPDPALIGTANGGRAYSVNGDNGNLNYDTGLFSLTPKLVTELEFDAGPRFSAFVRAAAFYDIENEDGDRLRTPLSDPALERVGSRVDILDAYFKVRFDLGNRPAEIRVGKQVLSWGESTFIQNSINTISPIDVSALRVPGAELREGLLPEHLVWANFTLTGNTSLELFYQYRWNDTEIDPPGSYFATNDFAGDGGSTVFLGFGDVGDVPPFSDPTAPNRPFLGVQRAPDVEADDGGQYGLAFRWFVPALNETEFGFYYINYHSRLPLISGRTGTLAGAMTTGAISASAAAIIGTTIATDGDVMAGAGAAGPGVPTGAALGIAGATAQAFAAGGASLASAVGAQTASAFAVDAYSRTARYFIDFPEDIELFGASFNTSLGTSGIALQGEASYRVDAPLQVDDVELLFAALAPINPVFAGNSGIPGEPGASQLATFTGQDYSTQFETNIPGYLLRDVVQYQTTATKIFGPKFGASQTAIVGEAALTHVQDMPDKDELRLEGPGTYTSGNPYHAMMGNPGAGHVGKAAEPSSAFADATSWGYRVAARLDYINAIGPIALSPRVSFQHDVNGNSPGPGGNFIEDRKGITVGVRGVYQNTWEADLSWTRFYGAGRYNLIHDRDFIAASLKYSF